MASRNYPKGAAKRQEILDVALEAVARNGYGSVTIRSIAEAAELSKTGVSHHFASKSELMTAVLARRDEVGLDTTQEAGPELLFATIHDVLAANAKEAGLMELYIRLAAESTDPGTSGHEFFRRRYRQLEEFGVAALTELQRIGNAPTEINAQVLSTLITAVVDGLQLRLLYEPDLDPGPVIDSLRALLVSAVATGPTPASG